MIRRTVDTTGATDARRAGLPPTGDARQPCRIAARLSPRRSAYA
jgi:hypothetical protein